MYKTDLIIYTLQIVLDDASFFKLLKCVLDDSFVSFFNVVLPILESLDQFDCASLEQYEQVWISIDSNS
jgi:hypothetical protein